MSPPFIRNICLELCSKFQTSKSPSSQYILRNTWCFQCLLVNGWLLSSCAVELAKVSSSHSDIFWQTWSIGCFSHRRHVEMQCPIKICQGAKSMFPWQCVSAFFGLFTWHVFTFQNRHFEISHGMTHCTLQLFYLERRLSPLMAPLESQQGSDADFEEGCSADRETKSLDRVERFHGK